MANNNHATKADLNALRTELKGDMATLRDELKADNAALRDEMRADNAALRDEMRGFRDELVELIRDTETKLLNAFYGFAEAAQKRMSNLEKTASGLTDLIATLDRRVTDLEKRVNFPRAS